MLYIPLEQYIYTTSFVKKGKVDLSTSTVQRDQFFLATIERQPD